MHILFHCDLYNDLRKTLFIKINDLSTLFANHNVHDKVCFLFNNTDSHISRLTANFVFQAFERGKKQNNNNNNNNNDNNNKTHQLLITSLHSQ